MTLLLFEGLTLWASSAAFNLNTPIVDDLNGVYISKPMNIGRRAIELAALGGFDKVTWDGASDSYPSTREYSKNLDR